MENYTEKQEQEFQAFIEYAYSQDVRYWAEQDYFGGFGSSKRSYVFSSTKEWLEDKSKKEFIDDDSWYYISEPRPIEEFPYWEKAFGQKSIQGIIERYGLDPDSIWFKDRGSIFTNSL